MSKHTPEPWAVDAPTDDDLLLVTAPSDVDGADLDIICEMHMDLAIYPEEWGANAALIIAAPKLLRVAKNALASWDCGELVPHSATDRKGLREDFDALRVVITKAEGK